MPDRLRRLYAFVLACSLLLTGGVAAQTSGRQGAPVAGAAALAPQDAAQALAVLQDDRRRAELIATLQAIVAASGPPVATPAGPPATPIPGAPTSPANPTAARPAANRLPLAADSLGAQLISQVSAALAQAGDQLVASVQAVNDLPLLWRWLVGQATDPAARALVLDALWKLLVVVGAGLATEVAGAGLLRRIRAALSRGLQSRDATPPPPDDPTELDAVAALTPVEQREAARSRRARRLLAALSAIRRLPFLVARLALDLVPIALFGLVANLLLGTQLGEPETTRGTILLVVQCYVAVRVILAGVAMLVAPTGTQQRLLHISDWGATFLSRWVRRLVIVGFGGYAVSGVGLQFDMYRTANDALLKLFALVLHGIVVVAILEAREPVARRIRPRHSARGPWAAVLTGLAQRWHLIAIFYVVALWLVWAIELRDGYTRLLRFFLVTAAVMVIARLVAIVLLGGLDRARGLPRLAQRVPGFEQRASAYYPVLRGLLLSFIAAATTVALLEAWGFGVLGWLQNSGLGSRTISALSLIGLTMVLAVIVWEGVNAAIDVHLSRLSESAQLARAGRLRTLLPMLRTVLLVTILLVVVLMTLNELGLNIAPLLAGAGVIGIAVGFGSQKLVQDLITGLFLLLENAMQVGDVVTLGGLSGTVEALSIRTIRLRALDGSIHIIPFSAVTTVTNQTRDYGYAVLDINIGLNEEPERIVTVLKDTAEAMRQEPQWQAAVLEPLDVMGVEKFIDLAWVMRVRLKTLPASRWAVSRELNRRIKVAFDELGIESPFTSHRALSNIPPPPDDPAPQGSLA